ncbi:hypothetical protein BJ875DRAFT_524154 [Amylocarpus encephaloides]|uniref:FAD-binding FR-type domain-containing protein n=1 Tax=Amylocarpus encephaloides TaxID=45428 RepID=A0A9P8C0A9_9HELO|nr:hypothetical protein BJ875DRAFT_524154 [Amylocarpus encephaloides]
MFRQIHRSPSFPLDLPQNLFAVIGALSLGCTILLCLSLFRRPSYELFLRSHQALAALSAYSIWRHLPSEEAFPRTYLYISAGLFLFIRARAQITHEHGAVRVRIQLQKELDIKAGQAIDLWIPSVSFWSCLQSHPFVPRRGLTRELLYHAKNTHAMNPLVMFRGPHGKSIPMDDSENILMVASDFGIAAHLPYLKQLIHGYNVREVRARRIHLVWQVRDIDVTIAAQPLLNGALNEDTLDDGWVRTIHAHTILAISIYYESNDIGPKSFGKRVKVYPGKAPLREIPVGDIDWDTKRPVERELEPERQTASDGQLLVTVSGNEDIRDDLRSVVQDYLTDGVSFFELDFQPSRH